MWHQRAQMLWKPSHIYCYEFRFSCLLDEVVLCVRGRSLTWQSPKIPLHGISLTDESVKICSASCWEKMTNGRDCSCTGASPVHTQAVWRSLGCPSFLLISCGPNVFSNACVDMLIPKSIWRWGLYQLGHEGGASINGISTFRQETKEKWPFHIPAAISSQWGPGKIVTLCKPREGISPGTKTVGTWSINMPAFRTMKGLSHPAYGVFLLITQTPRETSWYQLTKWGRPSHLHSS